MSLRATLWVTYELGSRVKANEHRVLAVMADQVRGGGNRCWLSIGKICDATGYDRRTVQRIIRDLEKKEVIRSSIRTTGGKQLANHYELDIPPGAPPADVSPSVEADSAVGAATSPPLADSEPADTSVSRDLQPAELAGAANPPPLGAATSPPPVDNSADCASVGAVISPPAGRSRTPPGGRSRTPPDPTLYPTTEPSSSSARASARDGGDDLEKEFLEVLGESPKVPESMEGAWEMAQAYRVHCSLGPWHDQVGRARMLAPDKFHRWLLMFDEKLDVLEELGQLRDQVNRRAQAERPGILDAYIEAALKRQAKAAA